MLQELAEYTMKVRPLRCSTSGPSLVRPPWVSHACVGREMSTFEPVIVHGLVIRAIQMLWSAPCHSDQSR